MDYSTQNSDEALDTSGEGNLPPTGSYEVFREWCPRLAYSPKRTDPFTWRNP